MKKIKMDNLATIISRWLKDQNSEWKVVVPNDKIWAPNGVSGIIIYKLKIFAIAYIYDTKVTVFGLSPSYIAQNQDTVLDAHLENFFPLLSNRLHVAGIGFKKAYESRERNKHHPNN